MGHCVDPSSLDLRFWGAPIFSPEGPKTLILKGFGAIWGQTPGAPQKADPITTDPMPHSRPSKFNKSLITKA